MKTSVCINGLGSLVLTAALCVPTAAFADDGRDLLKAMSDFMVAQKSFSFRYQSSIEAVTDDFHKLQFISSGTVNLTRPDKLHATRSGGFVDLDVVFDGTSLGILGKNLNAYAQIEDKGTLDELFQHMEDAGVSAPGTDIFAGDVFETLTADATEIKHVASAFVDGVECEYLIIQKPRLDLQIWIEAGAKPVPKRYVITSKHTIQAPEYTIQISDFQSDANVAASEYTFSPPADAKKVDLSELGLIDELPEGDYGDEQ
jgi:hypothetical protein